MRLRRTCLRVALERCAEFRSHRPMTLTRLSSPVSEFRPYVPHAGTIGKEDEFVHRSKGADLDGEGRVPVLDRVPTGLRPIPSGPTPPDSRGRLSPHERLRVPSPMVRF